MSAFKKRGGKLIQYHGWNDAAIPPRSSILYAEEMGRATGDAAGFYRLYLVPGMLHCGGGNGPSTVDWLAELDRWVDSGKGPAGLTATSTANGSQLLCPYPGVARKDDKGGWSCRVSKKG